MSNLSKVQYGYDLIFSLGGACQAAELLRKLELRNRAFPFDWNFNCTLTEKVSIVDKLLKEGAQSFLGLQKDLEWYDTRITEGKKIFSYRNTKNCMKFPHDFKVDADTEISPVKILELQYPEVLAKYKRRNIRLKEYLLQGSKKVLALWVTQSNEIGPSSVEIMQAYDNLNEICANNIDLLVLANQNGLKKYCLMTYENRNIVHCITDYNKYSKSAPYEVNLIKLAAAFTYCIDRMPSK